MLNHSCIGNAVRVFCGEVMMAHASAEISKGEEVVWSYIPPTQPLSIRQQVLLDRHGFVCHCTRCRVENELNTKVDEHLSVGQSNDGLVNVDDAITRQQLRDAFIRLTNNVFACHTFSNEYKRYQRVSYANVLINYLNASLLDQSSAADQSHDIVLLDVATQLHFAFASCHNASTEHISILHLCYELVSTIHQKAEDSSTTLPKLRFWTEQVKRAHMIRYGCLGADVESVRACMVHTRTVLRQKDGMSKTHFRFI
jgi:hypothetical protein